MSDEDQQLIDAMNLICAYVSDHIQEDWEIHLWLSKEAGCELIDQDGDVVDVDHEYGISGLRSMCDRSKETEPTP